MTEAGDELAPEHSIIEVHVERLSELFNSMDASAFRDRDLDPGADAFIASWGRELPRHARLALLVYLDRSPGPENESAMLAESVHRFFGQRAAITRQSLRKLFRTGRISLLIGLAFMGCAVLVSDFVGQALNPGGARVLLQESIVIGGWVALWRPLEIFLYDWWPIVIEARLFDRLAAMPVRIRYTSDAPSEDWRLDWPAIETEKQARRPNVIPTSSGARG